MRRAVFLATVLLVMTSGISSGTEEHVADKSVRLHLPQPDSLELAAEFFMSPKVESPLAIILHDREATGRPLGFLAKLVQESGYAVLLPDLRGHGESRFPGEIAPKVPPYFSEADYEQIVADTTSLMDFALMQPGAKASGGVIFALGESAGPGLALLAARPEFDRLYLISPLEGRGKIMIPRLPEGKQVFLAACSEDLDSRQVQLRIYLSLPEDQRRQDVMPCRSRGIGMLRQQSQLREQIMAWLER